MIIITVRLIRPPIVLAESGLNSEQVSLMRPIYIEKCISILKQIVLIERVVLILSGLFSDRLFVGFLKSSGNNHSLENILVVGQPNWLFRIYLI